MKIYNNRTFNGKTIHPCDHSKTERAPKKKSMNIIRYVDVKHAKGFPCGAAVLGVDDIPGPITCNKCNRIAK